MKSKSAEVKEKLFEIITPSSSSPGSGAGGHRFKPSSGNKSSKTSKRYRNSAPVFSIDDDHDPGDTDSRNDEEEFDDSDDIDSHSSISTWLKKPEVIASFECQQVNMQGYLRDR